MNVHPLFVSSQYWYCVLHMEDKDVFAKMKRSDRYFDEAIRALETVVSDPVLMSLSVSVKIPAALSKLTDLRNSVREVEKNISVIKELLKASTKEVDELVSSVTDTYKDMINKFRLLESCLKPYGYVPMESKPSTSSSECQELCTTPRIEQASAVCLPQDTCESSRLERNTEEFNLDELDITPEIFNNTRKWFN